MDNSILIISTGGTFNKIYNKLNGELEIHKNSKALKKILKKWNSKFEFFSIINKDSLDFTKKDRKKLLKKVKNSNFNKIVVIHGTDTIDKSAKFIAKAKLDKVIIFTGAMKPFSIEPIEATANLASAIGYAKLANSGVYISLNGVINNYKRVKKNREKGKFELISKNVSKQ